MTMLAIQEACRHSNQRSACRKRGQEGARTTAMRKPILAMMKARMSKHREWRQTEIIARRTTAAAARPAVAGEDGQCRRGTAGAHADAQTGTRTSVCVTPLKS